MTVPREERYSPPMPRRDGTSAGEPEAVGSAEIAARLGVRPRTVRTWRQRGLMPAPRWQVSGRAAWNWADIAAWARHRTRRRGPDAHAALLALEGIGWGGRLGPLRPGRLRAP